MVLIDACISREELNLTFQGTCVEELSHFLFFNVEFYISSIFVSFGSSRGLTLKSNHWNPSRWQRNAWFPNHRTDCSAEEEEAQAEIHRSAFRRGSFCNWDKKCIAPTLPHWKTLCRTLGPDQMNLPMRWVGLLSRLKTIECWKQASGVFCFRCFFIALFPFWLLWGLVLLMML